MSTGGHDFGRGSRKIQNFNRGVLGSSSFEVSIGPLLNLMLGMPFRQWPYNITKGYDAHWGWILQLGIGGTKMIVSPSPYLFKWNCPKGHLLKFRPPPSEAVH